MSLQIEETPNPNALKFVFADLGYNLEPTSFNFGDKNINSALVRVLFKINGVISVMLTNNFIVVRKDVDKLWDELRQIVFETIVSFFQMGISLFDESESALSKNESVPSNVDATDTIDNNIIEQIQILLDEHVKPALAMDGGSVVLKNFNNGIVFLELKGACIGCPSATITLKHGIENILKYYIPEVIEVKSV